MFLCALDSEAFAAPWPRDFFLGRCKYLVRVCSPLSAARSPVFGLHPPEVHRPAYLMSYQDIRVGAAESWVHDHFGPSDQASSSFDQFVVSVHFVGFGDFPRRRKA